MDTIKILPIIVIILVISIVFFAYFFQKPSLKESKEQAINLCIQLCQEAKSKGMNLENGPCLSDNNPKWNLTKWVCDIAHWPRQEIDNKKENQCNAWWDAYLSHKEIHFVELFPNCSLIRAV
ncbi:MAG: hypothetical protein B6U78_01105 [Candidatus Aenigmarchaeota archaeon ex4484_224]|nr:MAG: hypothetical protein B6U78_01105 [Candidatus Aenigmarchaeota archaeon ex4484_224]